MLSTFMEVIYPPHCCLCGDDSFKEGLCLACEKDLPLNTHACRKCALPMNAGNTSLICGDCLQHPPAFDYIFSPFVYGQPIEWMIGQLKFNHKLYFAKILAQQMWALKPVLEPIDCFLPIPLHPQRLHQRGFNQSLEIALELSRLSQIPVDNDACQRIINTSAQTGKNAKLRRRNIRGAFVYNADTQYKRVVLLDDVITTGSTVEELAKVLKQQGVKRVDVWSVARAARG